MNAIISFCTTLNKLMGLVGVFPQHCNAPLIVKMGVMTQEEADQKYQQMLVEMMQLEQQLVGLQQQMQWQAQQE